jgi:hypothetical protein
MGLIIDIFRFDGPPPDREEFSRQLTERAGSSAGLEYYGAVESTSGVFADPERRRGHVEIRCLLDPFTRSCALAIATEHGGRRVDWRTGRSTAVMLPNFARTGVKSLNPLQRLRLRLRWYFELIRPH